MFHGLRAGGHGRSNDGPPSANSQVASLPISTPPAAYRRRVTTASAAGTLSCSSLECAVVLIPVVSMMSLRENGMPCSGPRSIPAAISSAAARACAIATSSVRVMKLWSWPSWRLMRASRASASSIGDSFLARIRRDSSASGRKQSSSAMMLPSSWTWAGVANPAPGRFHALAPMLSPQAAAAKIVVTNWVHDDVLELLRPHGAVVANPTRAPWPRDVVLGHAAEADAVLAFMTDHIDGRFLAACPRLRIAACALKGFDNFDVGACTARGVWVTISPDLLTAPTAELAVGLAIALGRRLLGGDDHVRAGDFQGWRAQPYAPGLDGSTVGIAGMGQVGQAIARRLLGFGPRLLYADPRASDDAQKLGAVRVDWDALLQQSEFLILAVPLTADSFHKIDAAALARMKPTCRLVNAGRGSVVDEHAVAAALAADRLGGYAADVFE